MPVLFCGGMFFGSLQGFAFISMFLRHSDVRLLCFHEPVTVTSAHCGQIIDISGQIDS